jgi:hypothetical protein
MTPEERAQKICDRLVDADTAIVGRDNETWVATIIRAAENEALERAAMIPSGQAIRKGLVGSQEFMWGWDTACWHIAAAIRALKVEPSE